MYKNVRVGYANNLAKAIIHLIPLLNLKASIFYCGFMFKKYCLLLLICVLTQIGTASSEECTSDCVDENSWAFGIAVGIGELSNPVHDGKDFDFNVIPSFYYYGESFYVENTVIGYTLFEDDDVSVDLKGAFNKDGLYFNDSFLQELLIADFLSPGNFGGETLVSANDVERDLSYMGGVSADFYLSDSMQVSVGAAHDVTNVHNGYQLNLMFSNQYESENFLLQTSMGAEFRSKELNDYYYGLEPAEVSENLEGYQVGSGINVNLSLLAAYRINENLSVIARYKYEKLASEQTASPLIELTYSDFYFFGLSYQFGSE